MARGVWSDPYLWTRLTRYQLVDLLSTIYHPTPTSDRWNGASAPTEESTVRTTGAQAPTEDMVNIAVVTTST